MFAKQIGLTIGAVLLLTISAFGQGEFLKNGESGFGISPQVMFGRGATGYDLSMGYSAKGYVDLGFTYSKNTTNNNHVYAPTITLHYRGRGENSRFGIGIMAGYANVRSTDNLLFGMALYNNFHLSPTTLLQPRISLSSFVNLNSDSSQSDPSLGFGLALGFSRRSAIRPFINIGLIVPGSEDIDYYGNIGGGLVAVW